MVHIDSQDLFFERPKSNETENDDWDLVLRTLVKTLREFEDFIYFKKFKSP
jgi:hypothetical protein